MDDSFVFCEPCHKKVLYRAPMIIEVPQDHERFRSGQSIEVGSPQCSVK